MYVMYNLVKGTIAFNIFLGALLLYVVYLIVDLLDMNLLSSLIGSVVTYGVIILIILFTSEIRKFLLLLGDTTLQGRLKFVDRLFGKEKDIITELSDSVAKEISQAVFHLANTKTGALVVMTLDDIPRITKTGTQVNATISSLLLESIFFKNSPLHDGAVLMKRDIIIAASCILPVSKNNSIPKDLGLRHRAALGITETTETLAIVVSEETGEVSIARRGAIDRDVDSPKLKKEISNYFTNN